MRPSTDRGQQTHLGRADDRARAHRDIAGLNVVAGAADIGARAHATQHGHSRLTAVGPPHRQHRVGERRHRRTGLHPCRLSWLQPARSSGARLDRAHHGQTDLLFAALGSVLAVAGVIL